MSTVAGVKTVEVTTQRRTQLIDVTEEIRAALAGTRGRLVTLFVPHTTAGIVIQASGAGAMEVASDLEAAMERIVDAGWPWKHTSEGDGNPWSHVRAALTASSVTVPLVGGHLGLGDFQAVFLCEFDGPRIRSVEVVVH